MAESGITRIKRNTHLNKSQIIIEDNMNITLDLSILPPEHQEYVIRTLEPVLKRIKIFTEHKKNLESGLGVNKSIQKIAEENGCSFENIRSHYIFKFPKGKK